MKRSRFRDELLNEVLFTSLAQARQALRAWKDDYNTVRPQSAIGNIPPAIYAAISAPEKQRAGTPAQVEGSAPHPVAQRPGLGSNTAEYLRLCRSRFSGESGSSIVEFRWRRSSVAWRLGGGNAAIDGLAWLPPSRFPDRWRGAATAANACLWPSTPPALRQWSPAAPPCLDRAA